MRIRLLRSILLGGEHAQEGAIVETTDQHGGLAIQMGWAKSADPDPEPGPAEPGPEPGPADTGPEPGPADTGPEPDLAPSADDAKPRRGRKET